MPENAGEEADYMELFEKEIAKYENHVKMKSFLTYGLGRDHFPYIHQKAVNGKAHNRNLQNQR